MGGIRGDACVLVTGEEEVQGGQPSCMGEGSEMDRRDKEGS